MQPGSLFFLALAWGLILGASVISLTSLIKHSK